MAQTDMRKVGGLAEMRFVPIIVSGLVAVLCLSSTLGIIVADAKERRLHALVAEVSDARGVEQALVDAESGVRGYVLTGKALYLQPYFPAIEMLDGPARDDIGDLDRFAAQAEPAGRNAPGAVSVRIEALRGVLEQAIITAQSTGQQAALALLESQNARTEMETLRSIISDFISLHRGRAEMLERGLTLEQQGLVAINALSAALAVLALLLAHRRTARVAVAREVAIAEAVAAREQMAHLLAATEQFQSASSQADAYAVLRAAALHLFPGLAGGLYLFDAARQHLSPALAWGNAPDLPDITPAACWALKRGKPHLNGGNASDLACTHGPPGIVALELPMVARGELIGLLQIIGAGPNAVADLQATQPVAAALADNLSLALSAIALREALRKQALHDGLTGLYNRRFLDETLPMLAAEAHRRAEQLSLIIIDLDHFKRINDEHGHAAGDEVLCRVATLLQQELRRGDLACRYGGEEIAVLLPDCPHDAAVSKAEQLRIRVRRTFEAEGDLPVTASLGVATMPGSASSPAELIRAADAALYRAKSAGRDRVAAAPTLALTAEVVAAK